MEGSWLDTFRGQHVTVITAVGENERSDTGTLLRMGDGWLQLVKDNGEVILVPSSAVRLVKLLNMTHTIPAESEAERRIDNRIYEPNAQTI